MPLAPETADNESAPSDEEVVAFLRRLLPDFYFVNTPLSRMKRHYAILQSLSSGSSGVAIAFFRGPGASFSELVVCARDPEQPGLLSGIAAVLSATGVGVHTAWIHTLDNPNLKHGRLALDTFLLGESTFGRSRALGAKTQKNLAANLSRVLSGELNGHELLASSSRARQKAARAPVQVSDVSSARIGNFSLFKLRAFDSSGVLYRITRALSRQNVSIQHAQINTFEQEVDDVFFVLNADGLAFSDEVAVAVLKRLREELEQSE